MLENVAKKVFDRLWNHYTDRVVDARTIEKALRARNDVWNEDHVAFRTFPGPHCGAHVLRSIFESLGYKKRDNYFFEDKQLNAFWLEPPVVTDRACEKALPKVFISELIVDKFSRDFQRIVLDAANQVVANPSGVIEGLAKRVATGDESAASALESECYEFFTQGPSWRRPLLAEYETLRAQSEYAAWTLVFGSRINHFTVSVQLMRSFKSLADLNKFIAQDLKIPLNRTGGEIKGTAELKLEQSSSLACQLPISFQDGVKVLPYAFVEFAYRHPLDGRKHDGMWESYYQGFVVNNADKIFESTNLR